MILAFTGAGISKASGIPTFDEMGNIRDKLERTYANKHPEEYKEIINNFMEVCDKAIPNDAHYALAEYGVPVITMNIDGLHQAAGSKNVLAVHGELPNIVLYGDPAPKYQDAIYWVDLLKEGDIFLIIGTSFYTGISTGLKETAKYRKAKIVIINEDAEHKVREFLNENKHHIEKFTDFIKREEDWIKYYE